MRLFTAFELPDAVRAGLVAWQSGILAGEPGLRAMGEASLHCTLCFLGQQPDDRVSAIVAVCDGVVAGDTASGPRAGRIGGAIWLPGARPRVLAVAIEDDTGELRRSQARLAAGLEAAGVLRREARPYLPHVTVARVRSGERVDPRPRRGPGDLGPVPYGAITLFRSRPTRTGVMYEVLHRTAGPRG